MWSLHWLELFQYIPQFHGLNSVEFRGFSCFYALPAIRLSALFCSAWPLLCGAVAMAICFLLKPPYAGGIYRNNIQMNANTQGFTAELCTETRKSMLYTLPVGGFIDLADQHMVFYPPHLTGCNISKSQKRHKMQANMHNPTILTCT